MIQLYEIIKFLLYYKFTNIKVIKYKFDKKYNNLLYLINYV